jgi:hypothetical protein
MGASVILGQGALRTMMHRVPQRRKEAVKKSGTVPSALFQKPNYQHVSRARADCPRFFHGFKAWMVMGCQRP